MSPILIFAIIFTVLTVSLSGFAHGILSVIDRDYEQGRIGRRVSERHKSLVIIVWATCLVILLGLASFVGARD